MIKLIILTLYLYSFLHYKNDHPELILKRLTVLFIIVLILYYGLR